MAKDSSRITAGELQKKVEFRGQKTLKKNKKIKPNIAYITTCCLGGLQDKNQEKKMLSPKNNLQHICQQTQWKHKGKSV